MRISRTTATILLSVILLPVGAGFAGAATPGGPNQTPKPAEVDRSFISAIRTADPELVDQFTRQELIDLGRGYCAALAGGERLRTIDTATQAYLAQPHAGTLISVSVGAFCPKYWTYTAKFYGFAPNKLLGKNHR